MSALDTFAQYFFGGPVLVPYGTNEGAITEQGFDVGLGAGTPVYLARPATYIKDSSSSYHSIFQTGGGQYDTYTHITANQNLPTGTVLPAGTLIGTISSLTGWPLSVPNDPEGGTYYSSGPHLEYGTYNSLTDALYFRNGVDPSVALAASYSSQAPGYASDTAGGAGGAGSSAPPAACSGGTGIGGTLGNAFCTVGQALGLVGKGAATVVAPTPLGSAGNAIGGPLGALGALGNAWGIVVADAKKFGILLILVVIGLVLLSALLKGGGSDGYTVPPVA